MTYTVTVQIRHRVVFYVRFAVIYYGTLLAICFGGWLLSLRKMYEMLNYLLIVDIPECGDSRVDSMVHAPTFLGGNPFVPHPVCVFHIRMLSPMNVIRNIRNQCTIVT